MNKKIRASFRLLILLLLIILITGCRKKEDNMGNKRYEGPYAEINGSYAAIDDLGRELPENINIKKDKTVGIFYFLWLGQIGRDELHDNVKILQNDPEAPYSEEKWLQAGGGKLYSVHFWSEPMFGYYTTDDDWVMRKHVQMLTDAGVDYMIFDTTNLDVYAAQAVKMLRILDEYYNKGIINVPKVAFYTNTNSGKNINLIYRAVYKKYSQYEHLWFRWDGKPLIIGRSSDSTISQEARDFFRIKDSIWPNEEKYSNDAWPWMEFGRLLTDEAVYGTSGRKEVVSVSAAQHCDTANFSSTAWYGGNDHTRSWHDGQNDESPDAVYHGYNFKEQWEWAIAQNPESIFITAWNEWAAQRQPSADGSLIFFWDCADPNNSRDIEPMNGLFGDNYYMQMCYYIRKYKGTAYRVNTGSDITMNINGDFSQWKDITATYKDYTNDTVERNVKGFANLEYRDNTGRNDFDTMKIAKDSDYLYFYVKTVNDIVLSDDSPMTLFVCTGNKNNKNWYGYDYSVNCYPGKASLLKYDSKWNDVSSLEMYTEKNELMLKVDRLLIEQEDLIDIRFKWADNYMQNDIFSFYKNGDAAPLGRMNYIFSEKA